MGTSVRPGTSAIGTRRVQGREGPAPAPRCSSIPIAVVPDRQPASDQPRTFGGLGRARQAASRQIPRDPGWREPRSREGGGEPGGVIPGWCPAPHVGPPAFPRCQRNVNSPSNDDSASGGLSGPGHAALDHRPAMKSVVSLTSNWRVEAPERTRNSEVSWSSTNTGCVPDSAETTTTVLSSAVANVASSAATGALRYLAKISVPHRTAAPGCAGSSPRRRYRGARGTGGSASPALPPAGPSSQGSSGTAPASRLAPRRVRCRQRSGCPPRSPAWWRLRR
ncbi:hypothetical protein BH24CHL8_BH24CHL8_10510 [soil metagenome]